MKDEFQTVVEELFSKIDINHDGKVSLEEFIDSFHTAKRECIEELDTLELRIKDQEQRRNAIDVKLQELRKTEKPTRNRHPVNT